NSVSRQDMAVATSTTQLSRSIGAAVGLAILGNILASAMTSAMPRYLPRDVVARLQASGAADAGALFDPSQLAHLPPLIGIGIRRSSERSGLPARSRRWPGSARCWWPPDTRTGSPASSFHSPAPQPHLRLRA